MASGAQWIEAARPKTLPASLAPVLLGIGAAIGLGQFSFFRSSLALLVAICLQVGVNFSNDYSDGIRGTDSDEKRMGPLRLTGSKAATPHQVLRAALLFYALAALSGLCLVWMSQRWILLGIGLLALIAAWYYTGGKHPYGYLPGVAEIMVFLFFGWLAVLGTLWVQAGELPWQVWLGASGVGFLSCGLLMINNLRDIPGDTISGKTTLAVKLGDKFARRVYYLYLLLAWGLGTAAAPAWWAGALFALGFGSLTLVMIFKVGSGSKGKQLIAVLKQTGFLTLIYGLLLGMFWAGLNL